MCRHYKNNSKLLTIKNKSASKYAISHIHSNIPVFLQKKQNESFCHSYHKRTAYNLLTYNTFT